MKLFFIPILAICLVGCTTINVKEVDAKKHPISTICILKNPKVLVDDFLPVVEKGFNRHGIAVELHSGTNSKCCEYSLRYTARRSWDFVPFLSLAKLELKQHKKIIGTAQYKVSRWLGGSKWMGTESKMNPVIDELLSGFELTTVPDENISECAQDKPNYISPDSKPKIAPSDSVEIIESYGRIIFSQLSKKTRLHKINITIGDNILNVNGISVNKNNIEAVKESLKEYQLEISILGKGTALMRGQEVIKSF